MKPATLKQIAQYFAPISTKEITECSKEDKDELKALLGAEVDAGRVNLPS